MRIVVIGVGAVGGFTRTADAEEALWLVAELRVLRIDPLEVQQQLLAEVLTSEGKAIGLVDDRGSQHLKQHRRPDAGITMPAQRTIASQTASCSALFVVGQRPNSTSSASVNRVSAGSDSRALSNSPASSSARPPFEPLSQLNREMIEPHRAPPGWFASTLGRRCTWPSHGDRARVFRGRPCVEKGR
jgi:hypothetical protein